MKLVMENWRGFLQEGKFELKGGSDFFRVTLPGVGYAQGGEHLRFKECQSDVDAIMQMPEYKAFIDQAVKYSKSYGGVFVGAHYCTIGSGTSEAAKRVWKSLAREYNSSGDVIFIGL